MPSCKSGTTSLSSPNTSIKTKPAEGASQRLHFWRGAGGQSLPFLVFRDLGERSVEAGLAKVCVVVGVGPRSTIRDGSVEADDFGYLR